MSAEHGGHGKKNSIFRRKTVGRTAEGAGLAGAGVGGGVLLTAETTAALVAWPFFLAGAVLFLLGRSIRKSGGKEKNSGHGGGH